MRIKLLKKHNGTAKGSILDVPIARADYLVRVGVAEKFIEPKKEEGPKSEPRKSKLAPKKKSNKSNKSKSDK